MLPMLCIRIFQRIRSAWYDGIEEKDAEAEDESENGDRSEIESEEQAVEGGLGSMVSTVSTLQLYSVFNPLSNFRRHEFHRSTGKS